ncbi:MAG: ABC transporter ATP-binding protein [Clostridia bacterium]|nr:ABC transporter ATP-binding protein [Clostridia bacterium]
MDDFELFSKETLPESDTRETSEDDFGPLPPELFEKYLTDDDTSDAQKTDETYAQADAPADVRDASADAQEDDPAPAPQETVPAPVQRPAQRGYAFKVRNLSKDYGGHKVLDDISFDIPAGKIVGLLGPNGCGKTTLIKILAGLIHDYTGLVKVGGRSIGVGSKASVALLPDSTYFPQRFRTIDCINYFADFFADFDKVKAIEFASEFGLDLNQRIKAMSKGMQEKLQLLVVMSRAADIYLLDEPLGGVDPAARAVIMDIIMKNYKENATLLLSTHLVNDLEHSFDHVLMLGKGRVLVNTGIDTLRSTGKSVEEIFKEVIGDAWEVD